MYQDPRLALQMATVPDNLLTSQEEYEKSKKATEAEESGWWKSALDILGKADGALENLPVLNLGYKGMKTLGKGLWYPVDKAAQGSRWLYSNGVSQPISTVLLQAAKSDINDDWGQFFEGSEWSEAWTQANTMSPGQVAVNYENVMAASGDPGGLAPLFGLADTGGIGAKALLAGPSLGLMADPNLLAGADWKYSGSLTEDERAQVKRQQERFLYDTDYWKKKEDWKYEVGSGALDFYFVVAGDPLGPAIGAAGGAIKGARSIQTFERGGEVFRDRGTAVNLARGLTGKKAERIEDVSNGGKMNDFYDWVASPSATGEARKTAAEIAQHPIWGRGRRINPFANQFGEVLAKMPRDDMPLVLRMAHGDNEAIKVLAAKGGQTLDDIGRLSENRVHLNAFRFDDEILSYFYQKELTPATTIPFPSHILFYPPTPRPATAGAAQQAWDVRWGPLAERAAREEPIYQGAAEMLATGPVRPMSPFGGIGQAEIAAAESWKTAKMDLIQDEVARLQGENIPIAALLGSNLGKTEDELLVANGHMFGSLDRAYRMGSFGLRSAEKTAESKISKLERDRKGFWVGQTYRKGFYGTPVHVIKSLGDRTPEGRVNHNDLDAPDRVMDMLKRVPGLTGPERLILHDRYMSAGSKPDRAKALAEVQGEVLTHMATRVHGLDPEVAQIIKEMTQEGIGATIAKLTKGKTIPTTQAMSSAERPGVQGKAAMVDHVDVDGALVLAPVAKTQLSITDTLLPVDDIDRILSRNSGALQQLRKAGSTPLDAVRSFTDQFNTAWKATTLLRPAYTVRSVSEEIFLSAAKFGAFSRLLADPSEGMANYIRNKAVYVMAETGLKSYVPPTGKGMASKMAVVRIDDPKVISRVEPRKAELKMAIEKETDPIVKAQLQAEHDALGVKRIRVNSALPVVENRISMERELAGNLGKDINRWEAEIRRLRNPQNQSMSASLKIQALQGKITQAQNDIIDHQVVIEEFTDYSNEILRVAKDAIGARLFEGEFEAFGRKLPQAFTRDEQWTHTIPREQISSDTANRAVFGRGEAIDVGRAIKTGSWTYIQPTDPGHMNAWLRGINLQWRQDEVFRFVAEDPTGVKAKAWLKTPEGLKHLRDIGGYRSPDELVSDVKLTLDKYLPEDTGLWPKFAKGDEITPADLRGAIPQSEYPVVHGEEMMQNTGMFAKDTPGSIVDRIVAKGFNRLGTIPSDLLSRNPVFARQYEARMRTVMGQEMAYRQSVGKGDDFSVAEINAMREKADILARKDLRQVVYDPKRTNASEALRFIYPFLSAHTDSIARWGGMIAEKPQMVNTISKIYNAPVAANLVTDGSGNAVSANDGKVARQYKDPVTGKITTKREFVPIEERVLHLRAPWETSKEAGSYPIKLQAMNTILPGDPWFNPGGGPLVQVLGSEIAKKSPSTGDFLQWAKILPYGPTDATTSITPKYMRTIYDRFKAGDPDGEQYQKAYLAIYNKKVAEYATSGGKKKVILADIDKEAKAFLNLQILEAWGSPAQSQDTPLTGSPYQFFVDQWRQLQDADPENARDLFLERYGPMYFGFTASLSKSMGIAATVSADAMAQKYKTEIGLDPEMASFWIGNVYNGGPFSDSVYQKQLEESFGSEWVREKITAKDAITRNQEQAGWSMYRKAKLNLDNMLLRSGHRSYQERGAEGFNQARKNMVAGISQQFPSWGEAFTITDRGKIPQRIEFFQRAAMDQRLLNDPMRTEMAPLVRYLQMRNAFKQELARRGASQLSFDIGGQGRGENADLATAWDQQVTQLLNNSVSFNELYNRYLSNDHLQ